MEYTKGEWKIDNKPSVGIVIYAEHDGRRIDLFTDEWVRSVNDKTHQEDIANANLIAAAPDTTEALKHIIAITASLKPNRNVTQADIDNVILEGKQALAKAENSL